MRAPGLIKIDNLQIYLRGIMPRQNDQYLMTFKRSSRYTISACLVVLAFILFLLSSSQLGSVDAGFLPLAGLGTALMLFLVGLAGFLTKSSPEGIDYQIYQGMMGEGDEGTNKKDLKARTDPGIRYDTIFPGNRGDGLH